MTSDNVLDFWASIGKKGWWVKDAEIDANIHSQFGEAHQLACKGELDGWANTPNGALALIIVLDQFSRNMFRGSPKSFAQDAKALEIAKAAIAKGLDKTSRADLRLFFYLPFEHSEDIRDQEKSVEYLGTILKPSEMNATHEHYDIIKSFGRFPHRNAVLGRDTTPEEQAYLDAGGFKG